MVRDLGGSCTKAVQNAGTVQSNPTDTYSKRDLMDSVKGVSEKVQRLDSIHFEAPPSYWPPFKRCVCGMSL